jgi:hypothetical protein
MLVLSAFNVKKIMAAQTKTFHKAFADFWIVLYIFFKASFALRTFEYQNFPRYFLMTLQSKNIAQVNKHMKPF